MNFLLVILLVLETGVAPVYFDYFESAEECAAVRQVAAKDIPPGVPYVSACVPVLRDDAGA